MLSTERKGFEVQISQLCAGYNVPATQDRIEAYWRGLSKMHMAGLERCVEFALGEEYDEEKIPTTRGMWAIYRKTKPQRQSMPRAEEVEKQVDKIEAFANHILFNFLGRQHSTSSEMHARMVTAKKQIAAAFRLSGFDPDENPGEVMREKLIAAFNKLRAPAGQPELAYHREQFQRTGFVGLPPPNGYESSEVAA